MDTPLQKHPIFVNFEPLYRIEATKSLNPSGHTRCKTHHWTCTRQYRAQTKRSEKKNQTISLSPQDCQLEHEPTNEATRRPPDGNKFNNRRYNLFANNVPEQSLRTFVFQATVSGAVARGVQVQVAKKCEPRD